MNSYVIDDRKNVAILYLNGRPIRNPSTLRSARWYATYLARQAYLRDRTISVIWEDRVLSGLSLRSVIGRKFTPSLPWIQTDEQTHFSHVKNGHGAMALMPS